RMNIQLVDLAYDADTGCLVGDVGATMYTMPGTGKSYEVPTVNGVSIGTADFFKSGTVLNIHTSSSASDIDGSATATAGTEDADTEAEAEESEEEESSNDKAKEN
nr:hypothetical protein [Lachnospiraceae bacterium]